MFKKFGQAAGALAVGTVLLLAGAPARATADDGGAQIYNDTWCEDYGVFQLCSTVRSVYQVTTTNGGTTSYVGNGEYVTTATYDDGSVYSVGATFHSYSLWKKGEDQIARYNNVQTFSNPYQTCTFTTTYTYANGEIRGFEGASTTCL